MMVEKRAEEGAAARAGEEIPQASRAAPGAGGPSGARTSAQQPEGRRGQPRYGRTTVQTWAKRAVEKVVVTDDAGRAERLLGHACRQDIMAKYEGKDLSTLLDNTYVTTLQLAHEVLSIRDNVARSVEAQQQAQEKLNRVKVRERRLVEDRDQKLREALARENELTARLRATEDERDTWRARCKDAETQVALDREAVRTAEGGRAYAESQEQIAKEISDSLAKRLELEESRSAELQRAEEAARERAEAAEEATAEAERKLAGAETRLKTAEAKAEEALRGVERTEKWARETETLAQERLQAAEARANQAVALFRESPEFVREVTEASLDAYTQGFSAGKTKVAEAYQIDLSELEDIQPGED